MSKNCTERNRCQDGRESDGRRKDERKEKLPLLEALVNARSALTEVCFVAGLEVLQAFLKEDAEALCGPRYRHAEQRQAYRYGYAPGEVVLSGRRVSVTRPRVRSTDGKELPLPHYQHFSDEDPLDQATLNKVLSGIATRSYKRTLDRMEDSVEAHGVSKSAVSRRFIAATQKQLNEWLNRSLDGMDIVVLMVDGIEVEDHTIVVALGIDTSGKKHILGAREGTTENEAVCSELLSNLVDRGLPTDCYILVVIDGSKAIRKAVRKVFGKNAVIQRCQLHKIRNVLDHLPEAKKSATKKVMTTAYLQEDSESARRMLLNLADKLESNHPGAASSLREGLDETLTVLKLSISDALRNSLRSTNPIESTLSTVRRVCRNVKRWRGGTMILRWTVIGLIEAEKTFRRIKGMKDMPLLVSRLESIVINECKRVA